MISKTLTAEFRHFIYARLFFVLGLRMITTVVIYQVFHLANTYMVGFAGLAEFIPAVIAALFAGHYIDKHNKKNILLWSYAFYTICGLTLSFISLPYFQFTNTTKLTVIFSVVFCTGIIRSFAGPAANSMIAAIVPREELQNAITYNSSTWLISSIGGHAIGGLLIAAIGIAGAYFVTACLVFIAGIFALKLLPKPPVNLHFKEPMITSIKKGFSFVYHNKTKSNINRILSFNRSACRGNCSHINRSSRSECGCSA